MTFRRHVALGLLWLVYVFIRAFFKYVYFCPLDGTGHSMLFDHGEHVCDAMAE